MIDVPLYSSANEMYIVLPTSMECKPPVLDGEVDVIGIKSWRTSHHIFV